MGSEGPGDRGGRTDGAGTPGRARAADGFARGEMGGADARARSGVSDPGPPDVRRPVWPAGAERALGTPIQPSVVYVSDGPDALDAQYEGGLSGYVYAREGHPNADALAGQIDALEGAEGGRVLGSGMAAVAAALMGLCGAGDHVLGADRLYGRSRRMLEVDLPRLGVATSLADPRDAAGFAAAIRPETRMVLIEVVTNPTLAIADLGGIARACRERGIILAVDNTFTTPSIVRPLAHGADIVIESVTKMLGGHSDVTLGYVAAREPEHRAAMESFAATLGLTASPFDCWLATRGLLTFPLRLAQAQANAAALADRLACHPRVGRVVYPGRADHPQRALAARLLGEHGGTMVCFEIDGGRAAANALVAALRGVAFAPTLGDVETMLSHPASSSHRKMEPAARRAIGIGEGFFRISVGCESIETLWTSFAAALDALD